MELAEKIEHIRRCIKLGMDLESAMLIAECSDEEMDIIKKNDSLQRSLKITSKMFELDLLSKLTTAMGENLKFGTTADAKWFLERINSTRWGNKANIKLDRAPRVIRFVGPEEEVEEEIGAVKQTLDDVDAQTRSAELFGEDE